MALDNFRKVNITLNKANQRVLETQIAKVGDANGRELVVQITNNGVIEDQTGTTLKLNWQHENGKQGSTNFSVLDIKTGRFSVFYPKEMLYKGKVNASIEIISNGQITNSMNFKIIVQADVFDGEAGTVNGVFISLADVNKKLDDREKEYKELKERQTSVETKFDAVQQELTEKDVISAPEIIAARSGFDTLDERLTTTEQEVNEKISNIVSVNVKDFGAKGDGVTDDTVAVKSAIAHACTFAKGTGWKSYVPNILFPAGDYVISEPQALNPTISSLLGYNIVGEGYMNTRIKYTYEGNGENDYLMLNGGKSWWGFSYVEKISFSGNGNNNIWAIKSMGGSPQANRFNKVNFGNVKNCVTVLYGNMNANADLFRFHECKASGIYGWVFGVAGTQNSQSINHSFVNCDFETIYGTILHFRSGGEVTVHGGSWIVNKNGRVITCDDISGSGIGASNNLFTFFGTKFEWQDVENRNNDETYPLLRNSSRASINFTRCNFGQFSNAISTNHIFGLVEMGELTFDSCYIPSVMKIKLQKNDGQNLGYDVPYLLVRNSRLVSSLSDMVVINNLSGSTNIAWQPIAQAINCRRNSSNTSLPVDVTLNRKNTSKSLVIGKKIYQYFYGLNVTQGLPKTTQKIQLPVGSTLTKIYLNAGKTQDGYRYTYRIKNFDGSKTFLEASFLNTPNGEQFISNDLYYEITKDTERDIIIEAETSAPVGRVGHIDFEYI